MSLEGSQLDWVC